MIQSAGMKNWFPQAINMLQWFCLLFLPVTYFSDFATNKIFMIRKKTKFFRTGEISFKWVICLTVLPRAICIRTKSKVYEGAFLEK